jgi:hypothetical protein
MQTVKGEDDHKDEIRNQDRQIEAVDSVNPAESSIEYVGANPVADSALLSEQKDCEQ